MTACRNADAYVSGEASSPLHGRGGATAARAAIPEEGVPKPLILAIEPDVQQAEQISSMFRRLLAAELVLARSAAAALATLRGRVPELVLTSALIPPKDEAVITTWLRDLGEAGSHVQTVTIPVLSIPEPPSRRRGGALAFGRERSAAAPDSCDPAVFADWISFYLDLASTHRAEAR